MTVLGHPWDPRPGSTEYFWNLYWYYMDILLLVKQIKILNRDADAQTDFRDKRL